MCQISRFLSLSSPGAQGLVGADQQAGFDSGQCLTAEAPIVLLIMGPHVARWVANTLKPA
jgi:hypothetical protein